MKPQLHIGDVLLFVSLKRLLNEKFYRKSVAQQPLQLTVNRPTTEHNASDLVELLQKSAVEHLTTFQKIQARDFASVATIVTTVFEALYAYKCGDYQQCLQKLSTQNVHPPFRLNAADVATLPEFIQLLDDDIVSLIALTLIVNPKCRNAGCVYVCITQLTLSLYLMTQCQLKLRHSVTSLAHTLDYIKFAHRKHPVDWILNKLVLKMTAYEAVIYITTTMNKMITASSP